MREGFRAYQITDALKTFVVAQTQGPGVYQFLTQNFRGTVGNNLTNKQATQTATQETNLGNSNVTIDSSHITVQATSTTATTRPPAWARSKTRCWVDQVDRMMLLCRVC